MGDGPIDEEFRGFPGSISKLFGPDEEQTHDSQSRHIQIQSRIKLSETQSTTGSKIHLKTNTLIIITHLWQPLRTEGDTGSFATLTGTGSGGLFHLSQGEFIGDPRSSGGKILRSNLAAEPILPLNHSCTGVEWTGRWDSLRDWVPVP